FKDSAGNVIIKERKGKERKGSVNLCSPIQDPPLETWTESMVSNWLTSIGVKETYIKKLHEEEVDGRILCELSEEYLEKKIGLKSGPALLIIKKRDELINSQKARS
uniref:SAM domain-containing protein n=1 Tax=Sinocyclocheilus grahami TaxID=75366 RepID=A0A672LVA4_SINGR